MKITNSSIQDIETIFQLFSHAIDYQKKNGYDLWPQFSRDLIENEINQKRHWKITEGNVIACIFSVMYNDPVIWGEKDKDPAVYLHRIAINPAFKGKGIMKVIRDWAFEHARENNKKYVRMDTWGNNETIRNYYIKCGFNYIGRRQLINTRGLPEHYGGSVLSLFENEV
jgi:ribosomal protein S18 acetylase RimI-like enzyme